MRVISRIFIAWLVCALPPVMAQQITIPSIQCTEDYAPTPLKTSEMAQLCALPHLPVPARYLQNKVSLPVSVDNFTQPYMRPVGWQQGWECGQSAGIAYNFTYELDRLHNVSASLPENQYVTHFAWDFLNNGEQYVGVSAFDGWEIVRAAGTPNVTEYGGSLSYGGHTRWMSGYNTYYSSMHNRLDQAYQIHVGDPEGLLTLKQWLFDHLEGSPVGGIVTFYAQYGSPSNMLPAGTPEAGKYVMTTWGGSPSHTWTFCGYNDSIRYDYNGDGQYTNNIDINGDGIVTMKDWEIGGVKVVNGYGGPGWANNGTCYTMYKCLADKIGEGGIWNHSVFVLKIKDHCDPQLTYKATIKHTCRNMLKVKAGIALNTAATRPEIYLDFPIFNYQGGPLYMQGDVTEAAKTLEFGLDCTPLLSYVAPGQAVKYFLDVYEKDPSSLHNGEIVNFSVITYAGGFNETVYPGTNVTLNNNDTTRLSVIKTINHSKVQITTDSLPAAAVNEYFEAQLAAADGSPPYRWDMDWTATETTAASTFPTTSAHQLVFSNNDNGFVMQNLGFSFPFCGEIFDQVYVNPDGFLKFDNSFYTWPFLIDGDLLFKSTKIIGAFVANLYLYGGQGVWYEGNNQSATFRWRASVNGQTGTLINVAIKLFPTGKIELYYGTFNVATDQHWLSGISRGDNRNYQFTSVSDKLKTNASPFVITLEPPLYPAGIVLSEEGLFSGITPIEINDSPLKFRVTDNNNIWSTKTVSFSTKGIVINYSLQSGGDTIAQAGETALISMHLKNIGNTAIVNADMRISCNDTLVTINDSTEFIIVIEPDSTLTLADAFSITLGNVSEGHIIEIPLSITSATDTFNSVMRIIAHSFLLQAGSVSIADGNNNILEPGETAALIIELKNTGGAAATNIHTTISCGDPYISISAAVSQFDTLMPDSSRNMFFIISASPALPDQRIVVFNLDILASNNYHGHDFAVLVVGQVGETFETGDFTAYPWISGGNASWYVQDSIVYQGTYASRSGLITHNETSSIHLDAYVIDDGRIFFHRKVQCEQDVNNHNYDWLAFYIDGAEQERWDGDKNWAQVSYPVTPGNHTFKWTFSKDYSVSTGMDAGFVDNIIFPAFGDINPAAMTIPGSIYKTVEINSIDSQAVSITNTGAGLIVFTSSVEYVNSPAGSDWCNPKYFAGGVDPGSAFINDIMFNASGLPLGTYNCNLSFSYNFMASTVIPVTLEVVPFSSTAEPGETEPISIFPNPFRDDISISFTNTCKQKVRIEIFDLNGRLIRELLPPSDMQAGTYNIAWDGVSSQGMPVPAGIYLCRVIQDNSVSTARIVKTH